MIRLTLYLLMLAVISYSAWFILQNDGTVIVEWLDYKLEASLLFSIVILLVSVFIFTAIYTFALYLRKIPSNILFFNKERKLKGSLVDLSKAFEALASHDIKNAQSYGKKLLSNKDSIGLKQITPLIDIFHSELANISSDDDEAEKIYSDMCKHPQTELIGLKGLVKLYSEKKLYGQALNYAERAYQLKSNIDWVIIALMDLNTQKENFQRAEEFANKASKQKILTKQEEETKLLEIYSAAAENHLLKKEYNDSDRYLDKILKTNPSHLPSIKQKVQLLLQEDKNKKAYSVVEKAWKLSPSKELAELVIEIYKKSGIEKIVTQLEKLKSLQPDNAASYIILSEFLVNENMLTQARVVMEELLAKHEINAQISRVMAMLETKASAKPAVIYKWLKNIA